MVEIVKKINLSLSFDDARLDTYTRAYMLLKKYDMKFTLNVTTDFVLHQEEYNNFKSANNKSMTVEQLKILENDGIEIACHGHTHQNSIDDILLNIKHLEDFGIDTTEIGFASPNSFLYEKNVNDVYELVSNNTLGYIRSGVQIRRSNPLNILLHYIERLTHSPYIFYYLNKTNIIKDNSKRILMSVAITKDTTIKQITHLLSKLKHNDSVILMFHSVLSKIDKGYGRDQWYFDFDKFEMLCEYLSKKKEINVCTTKELFQDLNRRGLQNDKD